MGMLPLGAREVVFDLTASPVGGVPVWTGTITAHVELIERVEAEPDASDVLTKAVKTSLFPTVSAATYPTAPMVRPQVRLYCPRIGLNGDFTQAGLLGDAVVVARIELLRNGEVVASIVTPDPDESWHSFWAGEQVYGELAKAIADPARGGVLHPRARSQAGLLQPMVPDPLLGW